MNSLSIDIKNGSYQSLAKLISMIENKSEGYYQLLQQLSVNNNAVIIGITGAPGSGKSTLVNALIENITGENKRVGILCVDPSSPFNLGALLGDRIRMNKWYNHPNVFIRSLASRGALGGLHPGIIEITDVMKAFDFDFIIIETVGVGQSEVEIAGLADTTIVVVVPDAGDDVQSMKSGVMEIADIFVINKSDRPGADILEKNLKNMLHQRSEITNTPVLQTVATENKGIDILMKKIKEHSSKNMNKKSSLLAEKAFYLIREHRMRDIDKNVLKKKIEEEQKNGYFNLYTFLNEYIT